MQQQDAQPEPFRVMVQVPATLPEEVSGIHQSDDILRLLPPELATLGIEELEFEFYRRLLEKRLLSYRLQGDVWQEQIRSAVTHQQQDQQPRGPFIVCVDTSDRWAVSTNSAPRSALRAVAHCAGGQPPLLHHAVRQPDRALRTHLPPAASNKRCASRPAVSRRHRSGGLPERHRHQNGGKRLVRRRCGDHFRFYRPAVAGGGNKEGETAAAATSSVSMRWRCPPTANPASCASSIIYLALDTGLKAV